MSNNTQEINFVPTAFRSVVIFFLLLFVLFGIPFAIFSFYAVNQFEKSLMDIEISQSVAASTQTAKGIQKRLDRFLFQIESFASQTSLIEGIEEDQKDRILKNLKTFFDYQNHFEQSFIVTPEGIVIYDYQREPEGAKLDLSGMEWFQHVLISQTTLISEISNSASPEKKSQIALSTPIYNKKNESIGYAIFLLPIKTFAAVINELRPMYFGSIILIDSQGAPIEPLSQLSEKIPAEIYEELNQSPYLIWKKPDITGERILIAAHQIEALPWTVIASHSLNDVMIAADELRFSIFLTAALIASFTLILGLIWGNTVKNFHMEIEKQTTKKIENKQKLSLKQAELEQMELFSFICAHNMQEPLHKISLYCDILKNNATLSTERSQQAIKQIVISNQTAKMQINKIRDFVDIVTADTVIERIDLQELINQRVAFYKKNSQFLPVHFKIEPLPHIYSDRKKLSKILDSITENSIKFHQNSRTVNIEISAQIHEEEVHLIIKDDGIGIPPEYLKNIFDPFKRLHGFKKYHGIGIGLATCKKLAYTLGGDIILQSEPGKGTTAILILPGAPPV